MRELTRSNDVVFLSCLVAALRAEGIEAIVLDTHTSIIEGSIGVIPRRVMVTNDDFEAARGLFERAREDGIH